MPLGAFRLNGIARYIVAGGGLPEIGDDAVTSMTNVNYNFSNYAGMDQIQYCGDNSSGEPVYGFAYRDVTDLNIKLVLLSVSGDLTATIGTPYLIFSNSTSTTSTMVDFGADGERYGIVSYAHLNASSVRTTYFKTCDLDLDNLTVSSISSETELNGPALVRYTTHSVYLGNNTWNVGSNTTSVNHWLVTRTSGTSTTVSSTYHSTTLGGTVYNDVIAFDRSGSLYRFVTQNNGGFVNAGYFNGTSPSAESADYDLHTITRYPRTRMASLTSSNKLIMVSGDGTLAKANIATVTWPTSGTGAASMTTGTEFNLTDDVNNLRSYFISADGAGTAYMLYKKVNVNDWYIRELTEGATNTVVEGSATAVTTLGASQIGQGSSWLNTHTYGTLMVAVIDTNTNIPDFYIRKVA